MDNNIKRNHIFDVLKFVCAFLVIVIHTHPKYGELLKPFTRCAVPLFFMISGYFLYAGVGMRERLVKSIKKVSYYSLISFLLYLALFPIFLHFGFEQPMKLTDIPIFIFVNDVPFAYHLWYLPAFVYVLVVACWLAKSNNIEKYLYFFLFFSVFYLVADYFIMFVINKKIPFYMVRNFLFVGLPFFSIGMLLRKNTLKIRNNSLYVTGTMSLIISYIEWKLTQSYAAYFPYYFGTVSLCTTVFMFCMNNKIKKENIISKIGCEYSLWIYILHPILIYNFRYFKKDFSVFFNDLYSYLSPFLVMVATICLIYIVKNVNKLLLKYLYL